MALPSPLPDDPRKWDGWRQYSSQNFYERLCLAFESRPSKEQIEEHSRQLLVWWQRKLPLKNQPSNPIAQLLRAGMDAAPRQIAEARAELLNTQRRVEIDAGLFASRRQGALAEFKKFLDFALAEKVLTKEAEANLCKLGHSLGLHGADVEENIHHAVIRVGATREADLPPPSPNTLPPIPHLSLAGANGLGNSIQLITPREKMSADEERLRFPEFDNRIGARMRLVTTGRFLMGSRTPEAPINEQPATQVTLRRFYLARYPITNAQYEQYDPAHAKWRNPKAGDHHPVVYVSHLDALKFCAWLSELEGKPYRLPTEAEWEYAARSADGRIHPWAPTQKISLTKFTLSRVADGRNGAWQEPGGQSQAVLNSTGGRAEAPPVGSHPQEASPFGIEDLLGNAWEWCQDYYDAYKGGECTNPSGPPHGAQRVCRGGSWKSPIATLKATTRGCNPPTYASNDVGFRIACECD